MFNEEKRTRAQNNKRLHFDDCFYRKANLFYAISITESNTLLKIHLKSVFFNFADNEQLKNRAMQKLACYRKIVKQINFEF